MGDCVGPPFKREQGGGEEREQNQQVGMGRADTAPQAALSLDLCQQITGLLSN